MNCSTRKLPYESRLRETKVARTHIFSAARHGVRFVNDHVADADSTGKRQPLYIASRANNQNKIKFGRRNVDSSRICRGTDRQTEIFDDVEL